jgi:hypothetical protein
LSGEPSAERVARNNVIFRDANDKIGERAEALDIVSEPVPFLCECADSSCTDVILLTLEEYSRVRQNELRFIDAPGHDAAAGGWAQPVETHDGYVVVEKVGRAAELVEREEVE